MARQRSSRASGRWSRRGEGCTPDHPIHNPYTTRSVQPPHCVQLASISAMACGGGSRAAALAKGDVVKEKGGSVSTCKHTSPPSNRLTVQ